MTLCLAWWDGSYAALASDSRLTFKEETENNPQCVVDAGVKLSCVQCSIFGPIEPGADASPLIETLEIGCLFAGSTVTAYALRDHLSAVLQRLIHIPNARPLVADDVFDLIEQVLKKIAPLFREKLDSDARVKILLLMRCPSDSSLRSLSIEWAGGFFPTIKRDPFKVGSQPYVFGDAAAVVAAEQLINTAKDHPLLALCKIIDDATFPSVGGGVQLGRFSKQRLTFMALDRNRIDEKSQALGSEQVIKVEQAWGALDFNELNGERADSSLYIGYPIISLNSILSL